MKKSKLLVPILIVAAFIGGSQFASRTSTAPVDTISSTVYAQQNILSTTQQNNTVVNNVSGVALPKATEKPTATPKPKEEKKQYVLNKNTKKFHKPSCSSVDQMKEKNKLVVTKTRQEIIDDGYDPCGHCHP